MEKTIKTKEKILNKITEYCKADPDEKHAYFAIYSDALQALDEYGEQCFEAARETKGNEEDEYDYPRTKYDTYKDYLKTLEDEKEEIIR